MFAVVRTGGKQYRVAAGDKIAVEKLAGDAGETIRLGDVLLAGEGDQMADAASTVVSAEIIAQARSEKILVFKKRRRHNYRRKNGHRQQMTLLRIVAVGDSKFEREATSQAKGTASEQPAPVLANQSDTDGDAATEQVAPGAVPAAPAKDAAPASVQAATDANAPANPASENTSADKPVADQ